MDYEKKYKEALEKAKKMLASKRSVIVEKQALETIFPELLESEDEKMVKAITHILYENYTDAAVIEGVEIAEIVTWLEKQKELMPPVNVDPCDASWYAYYQRGLNKGYELGLEEGRKEQKPVQSAEEKEFIRTIKSIIADFIRDKKPEDVGFYQRIYDWLDGRHIEQKPNIESSPEEMKVLDSFLFRCWQMGWLSKYDVIVPEQKPAELSEEETKDLVHILKVLDDCYVYGKHDLSKTDHDNLTSTIKSLRPGWKPTEEQMNLLLNIEGDLRAFQYNDKAKALAELYEQLKRL